MHLSKKINIRLLSGILPAVSCLVLVGCMAPAVAPDQSLFRNELVQLSEGQREFDLRLQKLQDSLILLEAKIQDQQKVVEDLKSFAEGYPSSEGGYSPGGTKISGGGSSSSGKMAEGSPTEIYQKAFSDYASGRFQRAVSGFETFVRLYPTNDYVANALFWLGESYVNLQEPALALDAYARIADRYSDWGKTPEVLLKSATILLRMNRTGEAQALVDILREKYPKSNAAKKSLEDPRFHSELQP